MPACTNCGAANPDDAKFCNSCGTELPTVAPLSGEVRKTVTVVFTDVAGSTSIGEQLDPESLRRVMTRFYDEMKEVLERHGGTVRELIGDSVTKRLNGPSRGPRGPTLSRRNYRVSGGVWT